MKKTARNTGFRAVMLIITALCISFAFIHSFMPADVSSQESSAVLVFFQNLFNIFGISAELTDHIVRKTAHFVEFAIIGAMMMNTAYSFNKSRPYKYYFTIMFSGLMTAVVDETIQLNVPGRAGMVTDVLLDFSGVITGSLIMLIILSIYKKLRKI